MTLFVHVVRYQTSVKGLAFDTKFPFDRNSPERDNILVERCTFQECVSVTSFPMTHSSRWSVSWENGMASGRKGTVPRDTSQLTKHQQRACEKLYVCTATIETFERASLSFWCVSERSY